MDYSSGKEKEKYPPLDQMIGDFAAAMTADNITMEALKAYFTENTGKKAVSMTSFSSAVKYSSVTFEDVAYVLGAPEIVLRDDYILYEAEIEQYAFRRTLVIKCPLIRVLFGSNARKNPGIPIVNMLIRDRTVCEKRISCAGIW